MFMTTDSVQIGGAVGQVHKNSPFSINQSIMIMMIFGTMIISAVMGVPVYRDFEYNFHEIMFTTPVKKWQYLGGRFIGSYLICIFIFSGLALGILIGSLMPWIDPARQGAFKAMSYIQPMFNYVLPNCFLLGALFFSFGSLFRSQLAIYVQGVVVFVLYLATLNIRNDIENSQLFALLDPFGTGASFYQTRYWTVVEKNTLVIQLKDLLLYNRLIWLGVSIIISFVCYRLFKFSKAAPRLAKKSKAIIETESVAVPSVIIPQVTMNYSFSAKLKQFFKLVKFDFLYVIKAVPFISMALCGVLILMSLVTNIGKMYGTATYPVTYVILDALIGNFTLFIIIIITFYSGEMIWRDISARFSNISDALPLQKVVVQLSKFTAMLLIIIFMNVLLMITGILIQSINGFYDFQVGVYIKQLFLNQFPYYVLLTLLAFFIHNMVNNKFIGFTLMILYYVAGITLQSLEITHNMLWYGNSPTVIYSDMNGFGHFMFPIYAFYIYWAALGVVFFMIGLLMSKRGSEIDFKARVKKMRAEWKFGTGKLAIPLALLVFILCGGFIYYNTNIENKFQTPKEGRHQQAEYEKKFRKYLDMPQPRIVDVKVNVDIFPYERKLAIKGTYIVKNKTDKPIDSLHIAFADSKVQIRSLKFSTEAKGLLNWENQYFIYRLAKPLEPQDSINVDFLLFYEEKGFPNDGGRTDIVYNGTFVNNSLMPSFGYNEGGEISDEDYRKKEGLKKQAYRMRPITDTIAYRNTYLAQDADYIRYDCVVSTAADQIAISPGYLQKEWTENGRKYFHYKMDRLIDNFYSFLSARYEVFRDKWTDPSNPSQQVNIEIYYNNGHGYNLQRMNNAIKKTLTYCSKNFSPYQHKQVRIIEFPRYQSFAQSFPNTIPFSEGIGFIYDVDNETDIDNAFYVTAHEVAHQWWGHQVCGAAVQGSTLMVESMAQYTALMVMEHEYGKGGMDKFLKYELDGYLRGRSGERIRENPLMYNENQGYIHYRKGSCVMYALKDYIGEDTLNAALSSFIKKYGYQEAPYVTSVEFVNYLRNATPDSLKGIIKDMFETITVYNLKTTDVKSTMVKLPAGSYKVDLSIETLKATADSIGNEKPVAINDWIDVGVYADGKNGKDSLIYLQKYLIQKEKQTITIRVNQKPSKAGIDPLHKLIDRNTEDNNKKIEANG